MPTRSTGFCSGRRKRSPASWCVTPSVASSGAFLYVDQAHEETESEPGSNVVTKRFDRDDHRRDRDRRTGRLGAHASGRAGARGARRPGAGVFAAAGRRHLDIHCTSTFTAAPSTTATAAPVHEEDAVPRIGVTELKAMVQRGEVTVIDVRDDNAYRMGHIPGSLHIPFARIEGEVGSIPKTKPIVTVCT
jgi:hypothetical protein